jgi:hypothetical protein
MQTGEIIMNATHHRVSHLVRVARIGVETAQGVGVAQGPV